MVHLGRVVGHTFLTPICTESWSLTANGNWLTTHSNEVDSEESETSIALTLIENAVFALGVRVTGESWC
jgi:hypothetical protein